MALEAFSVAGSACRPRLEQAIPFKAKIEAQAAGALNPAPAAPCPMETFRVT